MRLQETAAFSLCQARLRLQRGEIAELLALYDIDFNDVRDMGLHAADEAYALRDDPLAHAGRFVGAVGAAIVLGIELARLGEAQGEGKVPA